jgi:hypothetical protein
MLLVHCASAPLALRLNLHLLPSVSAIATQKLRHQDKSDSSNHAMMRMSSSLAK